MAQAHGDDVVRRDGELVVAIAGNTTHLAHAYGEGAIFAVCGIREGLEKTDQPTIACRRCRVGAADAVREHLHDCAEWTARIDRASAEIAFLRAALGGNE